jgi:hypothetical protein
MTKGLSAFWKWMEEKGYCEKDIYGHYFVPSPIRDESAPLTKQMLIGYMIEYLEEKENDFYIDFHDSECRREVDDDDIWIPYLDALNEHLKERIDGLEEMLQDD